MNSKNGSGDRIALHMMNAETTTALPRQQAVTHHLRDTFLFVLVVALILAACLAIRWGRGDI